MIVKGENMNMVHLSEIGTLVVNSTSVSITSALICELVKNKVNLIMCDEKHNPLAELNAYYGAYNTSKKVRQQVEWDEDYKKYVWTLLIQQKIMNQQMYFIKLVLYKRRNCMIMLKCNLFRPDQ